MVGDGIFVCNSYWLTQAYSDRAYNGQWSFGTATHGTDGLPTFYNPTLAVTLNGVNVSVADIIGNRELYQGYQSYLVSHARSGDPNTYRNKASTIEWPKAGVKLKNSNMLNTTNEGFRSAQVGDRQVKACDFWRGIYLQLAARGGR
jgi:hypothetical protein